jgi:hypothetical protein
VHVINLSSPAAPWIMGTVDVGFGMQVVLGATHAFAAARYDS